ncbi:MAG: iron chelate uptake ABC transporter family permease subunit [Cutibacterium granulosum]|jgi:iron chelate uptake ABC transporter, feCT family, permease protein|uniref:FecCD family ABC transporter permease n=1 Tax=Cutibacterium granulosum TaxID=33011 RepID=UPI00290730D4|nr:iron chelate uptake ABC transporter family permease subunit [Cutibacterium granulosum]MDU3821517.1 iron chelate uptake ABC transporter family permease subunit [Cutibacterium granulosum]MEA5637341.1 iron chelate uptake ABC transporter family permease subunit [Cutibacterium granulosum]MEA5641988.1 iron chelate uptake ABC transporter family permease subunit [Cutibacterium granulosum]MEA5649283.1 iron chelate uptake ABC transporter family permease subunit [Cutibacterium granulosum]MEA5649823.1 
MIRSRNWLLAAFLGTALVASALVVLGVGAVHVPVHDVIRVVARRFRLINGSDVTVLDDRIVWQLRAPRVIGAMAVGALLAMCGAVLQTLTGNELADPYLLGISSGASVGAVLVIVVGMSSALGQSILMAVASFAGAVGALIIVLALATGRSGELPTSRTILAGVAVGQLCAAGVSMMIMVFAESNAVRSVLSWTLGSFTGLRWGSTVTLSVVTVPAFIAGMAVCHTLDAFAFGDVSAMSLGIPVNAVRWSIMVGTALLTALCVAFVGPIGFVGLIVPHIVRFWSGPRHARLLPASALVGALLMLWSDTAARCLRPDTEIPVGVVTAVIGAPVLVILLRRQASRS